MKLPDPHRTTWPSTLLVLAVGAVLFAPYRHFTTDDAFIHFRFAEHLAAGRGWSYNDSDPTHGDTAPLWVLLLAAGKPLAGGVPQAAKVLDAGAVAASVLLFAALARRRMRRAPSWSATAITLLFLLDPWFLKWGLSGMETPLAVALVLLTLLLRDRIRGSGRADPFSPLVLGIACLVRPECALLLVALAVEVAAVGGRRRRLNLLLIAVLPALVLLPWFIYAHSTFGVLLPNTFGARRDLEYSTAYRLAKAAKILASAYALPIAGIVVALARRRLCTREAIFSLLGATLVIAFYLAWGVSVGARYLLLVTPLLTLLGYASLTDVLASRPRVRAGALLAAGAQLIVVQLVSVRFVTAWPEGMDSRLFELARWLRSETPSEAVVAAHEIGVLGYVSGRTILDLAGLVSPDVPPVARTGSVAASLAAAERAGMPPPDYLVWNANEFPDRRLLADMAGRLAPLITREVQREGSSHGGGSQYYTIYQLKGRRPGEDSGR